MPEDVRKMITRRFLVPKKVIKDIRDRLDRPIMACVGIREKIVPKCFKNEDRTLDKRIVVDQRDVIPKELARE
jgi:hypothetical protein